MKNGLPSRGLRSAAELAASKPHGVRLRYYAGCRCEPCRAANREYERARKERRERGESAEIVSASRVRAHLSELAAHGVGYKSVAKHARVCCSSLGEIKYGRKTQIRATTQRKVLAVTVAQALPLSAKVPAGPTRQRVRALRAIGMTKGAIALAIGRKTPALQFADGEHVTLKTERQVLDLYRARIRRQKRRPWTEEEIATVRRDYAATPTSKIADALGRTVTQIYARATKLGLSKSSEYLAGPGPHKFSGRTGIAFRFKKGQEPPNKGLRRPGYAPGRMRDTQFKKGGIPHTLVPIGTEVERKDGYIFVKVSDDAQPSRRNWKSRHQAVWESKNGSVPPKHIVVFRDKNKRNFALDNLELITLGENALRNGIHRYPRELVQVMQLRGALTRQINKRRPPPKARRGRPPKRPATTESKAP